MKFIIVTSIIYVPYGKTINDIVEGFANIIHLFGKETKILLYTIPTYYDIVKDHCKKYSNIHVMLTISPENNWIYKLSNEIEYDLPNNRNELKDTNEFLLSGQTKYDFIEDVINVETELLDLSYKYIMWMDSTIFEIIKTPEETATYFEWISQLEGKESFLTFPGCWSKLEKEKSSEIFNTVNWRFCGGFFAGDKNSVAKFCETYKTEFTQFLKTNQKMVWDFNFWAWMESNIEGMDFGWYKADHNDSIFMISADTYTNKIPGIIQTKEYNYPPIENFYPTSASYLYYEGQHWLNTRYVNYWIYPSGCYLFHNHDRVIDNKNILSELSTDTLYPINFREIEEKIKLPTVKAISSGLEDIRLFSAGSKVKYIATTAGYTSCGKSRIITGNYSLKNGSIEDGIIIQPPDSNADSWCEKNWIPIVKTEKVASFDEYIYDLYEEFYVYKWSPMEIGKINSNTQKLEIVRTNKMRNPIFSRIRGSTTFTETDEGYVGLVHYSEEHSPRHYYHMLVLLDKETFSLLKYSEPFYFEKLGIEFCIGMQVDGDIYRFWISRHDRDPMMMEVDKTGIRWNFDVHPVMY